MEKKTLLAVALSIGFLLLWSMWANRNKTAVEEAVPQTAAVPAASSSAAARVPAAEEKPASAGTLVLETMVFDLELEKLSGGISRIGLKQFDDASNRKVDLLGQRNVGLAAFGLYGSTGRSGTGLIPDKAVYRSEWKEPGRVVFTRRTDGQDGLPAGIQVEKEYVFSTNSYLFEVILRFRNTTGKAVRPGEAGWGRFRTGFNLHSPQPKRRDNYNQIVMSFCRGGDLEKVNSGDKVKKKFSELEFSNNYEWAALADRYFILSLVAADRVKARRPVFAAGNNVYGVAIEEDMPDILPAGESVAFRYFVYAGPKDRDLFRAYRQEYKAATGLISFERAMGFNKIFGPVGNVLLDILTFLHRIVGSYGWSIILLTVLIKIIFFPLSYKQYESMARMKELQPAITGLKERYKNDAQALNKETMALYKKHKINPLGGCLPMLLQIPVFFAFYDLLSKSIKLRGVPFFWIRDLASPDTVAVIAGFPINILPLLMTLTMLVQQHFTAGTDPQQKKMMMFMPIFFLFIFWNMPAGLTLYWACQNIFGIGEQLLIRQRMKNRTAPSQA